jgi:hypothetical protein
MPPEIPAISAFKREKARCDHKNTRKYGDLLQSLLHIANHPMNNPGK